MKPHFTKSIRKFAQTFIAVSFLMTTFSSGSAPLEVGATTNLLAGLKIHLLADDNTGKLDATQPIVYELTCLESNKVQHVFVPVDLEYFCQVDLFDANNIVIPKTETGKRIGVLFDSLESNPKYIRHAGPFTLFLNSTNEVKTRLIEVRGGAVGPTFFRSADLFEITNAGEYKLQLHFQFLESTTNSSVKLIRFPTIELKVIRP